MPELPEVETIRLALSMHLQGQRIVEVRVYTSRLRKPLDQNALAECCLNRVVEKVLRRGKYLIMECGNDHALIVHLGMTGGFRFDTGCDLPGKHDHAAWKLSNGRCLWYNDPRRFGCIIPVKGAVLESEDGKGPLPRLGLEPLSRGFTAAALYRALQKHKSPVKSVLLNQSVLAGIGNIYAGEALFIAGIDPRRRADRISQRRCRKLHEAVRAVLSDAITCGGTTISDFRSVDGLKGSFAVCLQTYGKEGEICPSCKKTAIKRLLIAGRSTFYCSRCQR